MKKSLQDQLVKAGLGNKQQARQINHAKKKAKGKQDPQDISNTVAQQQAAQKEKDRQRNLQIQQAAEAKAQLTQIIQLIESNSIALPRRGLPYYFIVNNTIKKCIVDERTRIQLACGQIGIVCLKHSQEPSFHCIAQASLDKLRAKNAQDYIVWCHSPTSLQDYLRAHEMEDWSYPKDMFM